MLRHRRRERPRRAFRIRIGRELLGAPAIDLFGEISDEKTMETAARARFRRRINRGRDVAPRKRYPECFFIDRVKQRYNDHDPAIFTEPDDESVSSVRRARSCRINGTKRNTSRCLRAVCSVGRRETPMKLHMSNLARIQRLTFTRVIVNCNACKLARARAGH